MWIMPFIVSMHCKDILDLKNIMFVFEQMQELKQKLFFFLKITLDVAESRTYSN